MATAKNVNLDKQVDGRSKSSLHPLINHIPFDVQLVTSLGGGVGVGVRRVTRTNTSQQPGHTACFSQSLGIEV